VEPTPENQAPTSGAEAPATAIEPEVIPQIIHQAELVGTHPSVRPQRVRKPSINTTIYHTYLSEDLMMWGKLMILPILNMRLNVRILLNGLKPWNRN
jgi:hypothetical protein